MVIDEWGKYSYAAKGWINFSLPLTYPNKHIFFEAHAPESVAIGSYPLDYKYGAIYCPYTSGYVSWSSKGN